MAITDLLERLSGGSSVEPDELDTEIPDDASELDAEPDDLLPPDPPPVRKSKMRSAPAPSPKTTAGQRKTVKDAWSVLLGAPAGLIAIKDPICGGAAVDQVDALAAALTKVTCRNPAMLAWFVGDAAPWMDWLAVVMAVRPIVSTVWGHHVSHSLGQEDETDDTDYSLYTAPQFG